MAAPAAGLVPPSDPQAEAAVISAAMLSEEAADHCASLRPDQFFAPAHRAIWSAIQRLRAEGSPTDVVTVARVLREAGELRDIGGPAYLGRIVDETPAVANAAEHARIVADLALRRRVIETARAISAEGYQLDRDASGWAEQAARRLATVAETGRPAQGWQWTTAAGLDEALPPIPWVVEGLEIAPGPPTMIAGYGYSAKTVSMQSLALSVAAGRPVWGVFEAAQGRVRHIDYEQGRRLTLERYQRLGRAMGLRFADLGDALGFVSLPPEKLDSSATEQRLVRELSGITLAIIDSYRAGAPAIDENSSEARAPLDMLARVSEATSCAIVVIHHARKTSEGDSDGRQILRGSSGIYDACQAIWTFTAGKGEPTCATCAKARLTGRSLEPFRLQVEDVGRGGAERWGLRVRYEEEAHAQLEAADRRRQARREAVLAALRERPDVPARQLEQTMRDLGHRVRNGSAAVVLEELERDGLVVQWQGPADRHPLWRVR